MSNWTHYTESDRKEADRLLKQYPQKVVAQKTGIPFSTLQYWIKHGHVEPADHRYGPNAGWETVERADDLYDRMPLADVAEVLDMKKSTLDQWQQKGWISTDTNHRARSARRPERNRKRAHRAARLVYDDELTQAEAADRMGVTQSSISRYLRMYRTQEWTT